jgi:predicted DNA-binding transcriptional regulator YafY
MRFAGLTRPMADGYGFGEGGACRPGPPGRAGCVVSAGYVDGVNRTDRLYALVEELRAVAPRPRSARWLAERFEVSPRTVERDISALQQASVPIYAEPGRAGGYVLDRSFTLPPVNVTPAEAVALAVSLHRLAGTPFEESARSALHKIVAVMAERDAIAARGLAARVHFIGDGAAPPVPPAIADAVAGSRVLALCYVDKHGSVSRREVEPLGYVGGPEGWYLVAWCRLRGAVRAFRLDRIRMVTATAEPATPRQLDDDRRCVLPEGVRQLSFG